MKIDEKNAEVVVDALIKRIKTLECDCWLFADREKKLHEQIAEQNKQIAEQNKQIEDLQKQIEEMQIEELKKGGEPFGEL